MNSVDAVWRGVPELQADAAAAVALASSLARLPGTVACARGLGWLMALLRGDGMRAPADRTASLPIGPGWPPNACTVNILGIWSAVPRQA